MTQKYLFFACLLTLLVGIWSCGGNASDANTQDEESIIQRDTILINPWTEAEKKAFYSNCLERVANDKNVAPEAFCHCFLDIVKDKGTPADIAFISKQYKKQIADCHYQYYYEDEL